jgi:cyclase
MKATFKTISPDHWQRAQELRHPQTEAETVLWEAVRAAQLGPRFRRQHPIGLFIVDFCCTAAHLVIEIDGDQHNEPDSAMYDFQRTGFLVSEGYTVKRFSNRRILYHTKEVIAEIKAFLRQIESSPAKD